MTTPVRLSDALILTALTLRLGTIERATRHPDGLRPESDTTHSCMLALLAIALAPQAAVPLDAGLLAQLALVHDLAEAYAGDVNTAGGLDAAGREKKERREQAALGGIRGGVAEAGVRGRALQHLGQAGRRHQWGKGQSGSQGTAAKRAADHH